MEPRTVAMEPRTVAMEPRTVTMEPRTVAMEPRTVTMEPRSVKGLSCPTLLYKTGSDGVQHMCTQESWHLVVSTFTYFLNFVPPSAMWYAAKMQTITRL